MKVLFLRYTNARENDIPITFYGSLRCCGRPLPQMRAVQQSGALLYLGTPIWRYNGVRKFKCTWCRCWRSYIHLCIYERVLLYAQPEYDV